LYNTNTMKEGEWNPIVVSKAKTVSKEPDKIIQLGNEIAEKFATPDFLKQVVETCCDGSFERKRIGLYIISVVKLIGELKEVQALLEESGFKWKDLSKFVNQKAREFYVNHLENEKQ